MTAASEQQLKMIRIRQESVWFMSSALKLGEG
jgi:hypothetical protein